MLYFNSPFGVVGFRLTTKQRIQRFEGRINLKLWACFSFISTYGGQLWDNQFDSMREKINRKHNNIAMFFQEEFHKNKLMHNFIVSLFWFVFHEIFKMNSHCIALLLYYNITFEYIRMN